MRSTIIEINLEHLRHNLELIRKHTGHLPVMAVVKANAYGHGLLPVAKLYQKLGVSCLGVALPEEGICLRQAGIALPIVVFGGVLAEQLPEYLQWNLEFLLSSPEVLQATAKVAEAAGTPAKIHLKLDSGMGRVGTLVKDSALLIEAAVSSKYIRIQGVCSHLACADVPDDPMTSEQLEQFLEAASHFERLGVPTPPRHLANSGGVLYFPQTHLDLIRPGILLYGVYPDASAPRRLDVRPALTLKSQISFRKLLPAGYSVSYGATWTSDKPTEIATVPLGYGDGYRRHLSNRGRVLIQGKRYPIVGRVCMDQFMLNCGEVIFETAEEAILIGEQHGERITVEEMSVWAETIPYEILTGLNERIPRIYKQREGIRLET